MVLHEPFGHLHHKLWSKEGPGIDLILILVRAGKVRHTIEKLSTRATTLV